MSSDPSTKEKACRELLDMVLNGTLADPIELNKAKKKLAKNINYLLSLATQT